MVSSGCVRLVGSAGCVGGTIVDVPVGMVVLLDDEVAVVVCAADVAAWVFSDWEPDSVGGTGVFVGGGSVVGSNVVGVVGTSVSVGAGVVVGGTAVFVGTVVFVGVVLAGEAQISLIVITGGGIPGPQDQPSTAPLPTW